MPNLRLRTDAWVAVREFTYRESGVVLGEDQRYLLDSRVDPVARALGFASVPEFVDAACASGAPARLTAPLLDAMTTHETSFFRDDAFWAALESDILPSLLARGPRPLSIWSAACATGQEPYSLAMLIKERFPAAFPTTQILASDVSPRTVARSQEGVYSLAEANRGLSGTRIARHFTKVPGGIRIHKELRDRIAFLTHNLHGRAPYPTGFDMILCRNVLIYFNDTDRASVLARLVKSVSHGYLGLGATEMIPRAASMAAGWYAIGVPSAPQAVAV